ncbi:hypothetical protein BSCH_00889c [Candidatus Paraburkholderia schumanniana]|nr:hypothetical protein BSCH_00889c [Candidatus Paraburkholderia schumannianae]
MPIDDSPRSAAPVEAHRFAAFGELSRSLRDACAALGRELVAIRPNPARALFATQAMLSVGLAVTLAYAFHLTSIWWAAISGFAVMQSKFSACAQRGVQRVVGTVAGAIIGAVTSLMVTFEAHRLVSASATASFALLRVAEVAVGTFASVAVSALFHAGLQHYRKSRSVAPIPRAQAASTVDRVDGVATQTITVMPSDAAHAVQTMEASHVAHAEQAVRAMHRRLAWQSA